MISSEWVQIEKWVAAKSKIRASFIGNGVAAISEGHLVFSGDKTKLWLTDESEKVIWIVFPDRALPCERLEPLLDAPEEMLWKLDLLVAVSLRTPCGYVDFFEIGAVDTDHAPR